MQVAGEGGERRFGILIGTRKSATDRDTDPLPSDPRDPVALTLDVSFDDSKLLMYRIRGLCKGGEDGDRGDRKVDVSCDPIDR